MNIDANNPPKVKLNWKTLKHDVLIILIATKANTKKFIKLPNQLNSSIFIILIIIMLLLSHILKNLQLLSQLSMRDSTMLSKSFYSSFPPLFLIFS